VSTELTNTHCLVVAVYHLHSLFTVEKAERTSVCRKDAIGDDEKCLYGKAVQRYGNNWKQIFNYILENGKSLPKPVYLKYQVAKDDKDKIKSVRGRIANIGRKMR